MEQNFKINWITSIAMTAFHMGFIFALFHVTLPRIALALFMLVIMLCFGIGIGFHRLHTHAGFTTSKPVKYLLTLCGYFSLQNGLLWWVTWHRIHHLVTEVCGEDPHTPRDGKWWAHMRWMTHPDPRLKDVALLAKYCPDLCRDRFQVALNRFSWIPITVLGLLVWLISGLSAGSVAYGFITMSWAVFVPVTIGWHSTWLVNSATHLWGSRAFETNDDSRNSWWVALLTFGEGWHNNHHKYPRSARHGFEWYQIDINWYVICLLKFLRLVDNVKTQPKAPRTA